MPNAHTPKVLLVDDDIAIVNGLTLALQSEYKVTVARNVADAKSHFADSIFDVIILDLGLPDGNGMEVHTYIRSEKPDVPVIILSTDAKPLTKIQMLDSGADDYMTKPCSVGELKARLRMVLRKLHQPRTHIGLQPLTVGTLTLDPSRRMVIREEHAIPLRPKEFALLEFLMRSNGVVLTREQLTLHVWGTSDAIWTNKLDVQIKYLRDKIDRPFARPLLQTVHGIGYKLDGRQPVVDKITKGDL